MDNKKIFLSKKYYLVVGDCFQLFYRSVIKTFKLNDYYVIATCEKGYTYNRYFMYTPKENEVGEYELILRLYNDEEEIIDEAKTTLVVNNIKKPNKKLNILCVGDSLTVNGVWPYVGYSKYNEVYPNMLNFIGKMKKEEVGYEGYGGWQWATFASEYNKSQTSSVWVNCDHDKDDFDQHSTWENNGKLWILETIESGRLKFKRGEKNTSVNPEIIGNFKLVTECKHPSDIIPITYEYSEGNPFINKLTKQIDFNYYITENNFPKPDYVFFLLTWNGQAVPYNNDFTVHDINSSIIFDALRKAFPDVKIGILGIQPPCPNGGITACYGAKGYYYDWYGETVTQLNYNEFLENKALNEKYNNYMLYFDTKGQFDCEYNYYTKDENVNLRNSDYKERIGVNGIHPSMNGYLQIGDSFFRALVAMINKFDN